MTWQIQTAGASKVFGGAASKLSCILVSFCRAHSHGNTTQSFQFACHPGWHSNRGGGRSRIGGAASCGLSASGIFLSHFHRALPRLDLWRMGNPAFPNGCVTKILPSDKRAPVTELILRASSHLRPTGGRRFVLQ